MLKNRKVKGELNEEGYVNVAGELGISRDRGMLAPLGLAEMVLLISFIRRFILLPAMGSPGDGILLKGSWFSPSWKSDRWCVAHTVLSY
jgi:hypothetical protein